MMLFDMRTIIFSYLITDIICVWFMALLWRQSRRRFAGMTFLVVDFGFQAAALVLIVMRGAIPDWVSMVLSNALVIAGAILGLQGLERFVGKRGPQIRNYLLLTLFILVHGYFTSVQPNLALRSLNLAVALLLVCFQTVWLLWRRVEPGLRSLTFGVGLVNALYCLISVIRIVDFFVRPHLVNDYFHSGTLEAFVLISYQMLFILLTYSLVLMVNKRLLMEIGTQEEKFSKAFHSSPYAVTLTRLSDGKIIEINDGFLNITGYRHKDVDGKTTVDLRLWDREEDRFAAVTELSRSGKVHEREFQFRKKSGETITGLFSADIITIDSQECILSSISDITERKRAEEKLRGSEERYRELYDEAPVGYHEIDTEGRITRVNRREMLMLGYSREEMLGKPIWDFIVKEEAPEAQATIRAKLAGLQPTSKGLERNYRRKDGKTVPVVIDDRLLTDNGGRITGIRIAIMDNSVRKQAEKEQSRLAERIRLLLQSTGEGIYGTDTNGRFTFINKAGAALLGYSPEELIGKPAHGLVHHSRPDGSVYPPEECPMNRTLRLGQDCRKDDEVLWRKDGTPFPVRYSSHPIVQGGEIQGVVVNFADITERKRSEAALEEERRRLQKALEDVRTLRGIVPICGTCKKIRDDKGFWNQVEQYVSEHSEAEFSHGICPECMKMLYPEFSEEEDPAGQG